MQHLPIYVYITFAATVLLAIGLFYKAANYSKPFLLLLMAWLILQSVLGLIGFYNNPVTVTTRFPLLFLPPLLFLASRFVTKKGRAFLDAWI